MTRSACHPWLDRFAWLTAGATFLLLGLGGLVTSHEAGLAVPDWPTTYGYNMFLFPLHLWQGNIFWLYGGICGSKWRFPATGGRVRCAWRPAATRAGARKLVAAARPPVAGKLSASGGSGGHSSAGANALKMAIFRGFPPPRAGDGPTDSAEEA